MERNLYVGQPVLADGVRYRDSELLIMTITNITSIQEDKQHVILRSSGGRNLSVARIASNEEEWKNVLDTVFNRVTPFNYWCGNIEGLELDTLKPKLASKELGIYFELTPEEFVIVVAKQQKDGLYTTEQRKITPDKEHRLIFDVEEAKQLAFDIFKDYFLKDVQLIHEELLKGHASQVTI